MCIDSFFTFIYFNFEFVVYIICLAIFVFSHIIFFLHYIKWIIKFYQNVYKL